MFIGSQATGESTFTRLTKTVHDFEAPFDERFRDLMVATVEHLMQCGLKVVYEKQTTNPKTGEAVTASRRRIRRELELPMKDAYNDFVRDLVAGAN